MFAILWSQRVSKTIKDPDTVIRKRLITSKDEGEDERIKNYHRAYIRHAVKLRRWGGNTGYYYPLYAILPAYNKATATAATAPMKETGAI